MNGNGTHPKFGVILCDPPWIYDIGKKSGLRGTADAHYPVMTLDEIAAIPVASWAAKDCLLAMWATWPQLKNAVRLAEAWGFEYMTGFPWVKTTPASAEIALGVGHWTRGATEPVLLARRGKVSAPDVETPMGLLTGEDLTFYARRQGHSRKPDDLHTWLARLPGPHAELFARRKFPGWTTWGIDVGFLLSPRGVEVLEPTRAAAALEF